MDSMWKIGSVDVYVDGYQTEAPKQEAEHIVLDATGSSELHFFGSGTEKVTLEGFVFTETNKSTLEGYRDNNTTLTLTSDQGSEGSFKIDIRFIRYRACKVNVPGVSSTATVYRFQATLKKV